MSNLSIEQKFAKILLQLRKLRPFYSAIYEVMDKEESTETKTAGVTENKLLFNKEFIEKIPVEEMLFVMLHEVAHVALKHVSRREHRDPMLWNIACDLYVNKVLAEEFGIEPGGYKEVEGIKIYQPNKCLYDSSIDTSNDCVEGIYDELKEAERAENKGTRYNIDNLRAFKNTVSEDLIDQEYDQSSKESLADKIVADAVTRLEMTSKNYGDTEGKLYRAVKASIISKVDWRRVLRKYLIESNRTDTSFSRPDKRMHYLGRIYPGQVKVDADKIRGVKICIDTSGSISANEFEEFCGQVYDLLNKYKVEAEIIYWDTRVESRGRFTRYNEFERVSAYGGGGTDPSCIFNYLDSKECKEKPIVTLIFTDGYFSLDNITNKQKRKYKDTIWIMCKKHKKDFNATFGIKANVRYK